MISNKFTVSKERVLDNNTKEIHVMFAFWFWSQRVIMSIIINNCQMRHWLIGLGVSLLFYWYRINTPKLTLYHAHLAQTKAWVETAFFCIVRVSGHGRDWRIPHFYSSSGGRLGEWGRIATLCIILAGKRSKRQGEGVFSRLQMTIHILKFFSDWLLEWKMTCCRLRHQYRTRGETIFKIPTTHSD